jgi:pyrimidine-nucleoside phosphorylase
VDFIAIIEKKRDGGELSADEIAAVVAGFVAEELPDYQMAAFLMAVYLRGMTRRETVDLTLAMARSGEMIDPARALGRVDKHSTGGVGDKTTLVVAPLVAAAGIPVAKMSGRGLGHTGGTVDKLESIPGFRTDLGRAEFEAAVAAAGVAVVGQSEGLAPADKKIYALRDVTGTVASVPLIASSIMSKKLASGAPAIVLDVKAGPGSFNPTVEAASNLARLMIDIGASAGRRMSALVTDMSQPLGCAVGNALEVAEAVATLRGGGPPDLRAICLELGAEMLVLAGGVAGEGEEDARAQARRRLQGLLDDGSALDRFRRMVAAQGGDVGAVDDVARLPAAPLRLPVPAPRAGYVTAIHAAAVGRVAMDLGAGRRRKGDTIDHAVGLVVRKKVGDAVAPGEPLATVHARDADAARAACAALGACFEIGARRVEPPSLVHVRLGSAV